MDPKSLASVNLGESYNQPGISIGVVPSQIGNVSTALASPNLGQSHNQPGISSGVGPSQKNSNVVGTPLAPNISNGSGSKRKNSSLSESDAAKMAKNIKKQKTDKAYRDRCKQQKAQTESDIKNLKGENDSLNKKNESLKHHNSLMNQTVTVQAKEINKLRSALSQVKRDHENQNVALQTLSDVLADAGPMRLENKKLKAENASLRMNAPLDSNLPRLAEENAKLRVKNKVLRLRNEALCEKIRGTRTTNTNN